MNYKMLIYILGSVLKFEGFFLLLPFIVALIYQESTGTAFLIMAAICIALGYAATWKKPENKVFYAKEGFLAVSLSWVVLSIMGCLPFMISGEIPTFVDALFETISGFTTTGASILSDVEALSHASLFWRSFTHWIGGMGVLVFIMALLPMTGGYSMSLMKAESPGPSVTKLVPRVKHTAQILYSIYFVITVIEMILLLLAGMPVFDTITLSFGTAGTGGFAILNSGLASYTPLQQNIITVFMILFGINFGFYYLIICKKIKQAFTMEEVRTYLGIILAAILLITFNIRDMFPSILTAFQQAAFQVGSIITTTGYSTTDFAKWPMFSQTILVSIMFIGACAGSTGGGIKVSRFIIGFKTLKKELFVILHPRSIKKIKMDDHVVEHEIVRATNVFFITYMIIFFISLILISIDNFDFGTNFSAIAATLNNIGPGINQVGPTCNFGIFSTFSKYVMIFDMLVGRLEIFPMLALFLPSAWKRQ